VKLIEGVKIGVTKFNGYLMIWGLKGLEIFRFVGKVERKNRILVEILEIFGCKIWNVNCCIRISTRRQNISGEREFGPNSDSE